MIEEIEKIIKKYEKDNKDLAKLQNSKTSIQEELNQLKESKMVDDGEFEKKLKANLQERKDRDIQDLEKEDDEFIGNINTKDMARKQIEEEYKKIFEEKMQEHQKEFKEELKQHKQNLKVKDRQLMDRIVRIEMKQKDIEAVASDENIRIVTTGLAKVEKEIEAKKIQLKRKELEILEYYGNINSDQAEKNTKTIHELQKEQGELQKELKELEMDKEKYSEFLDTLKQIRHKLLNKEEVEKTEKESQEKVVVNEPKEQEPQENVVVTEPKEQEPQENVVVTEQTEQEPQENIVVTEQTEQEPQEKVVVNEQREQEPQEKVVANEQREQEPQENIVVNETKEQEPQENIVVNETKEQEPQENVVVTEQTEQENTDIKEQQIEGRGNSIINGYVRIVYNAKKDEYTVDNMNRKMAMTIERADVEQIDDTNILEDEDVLANIENLDINVIKLLSIYDNRFGTDKTGEYIKNAEVSKSKYERMDAMEDSQIEIEYNLKGLYAEREIGSDEYEDVYTEEERKELLRIANKAKESGLATVKKGIYVMLREQWDNVLAKIASVKERLALSEGSEKEQNTIKAQEEKNEEKLEEAQEEKTGKEDIVIEENDGTQIEEQDEHEELDNTEGIHSENMQQLFKENIQVDLSKEQQERIAKIAKDDEARKEAMRKMNENVKRSIDNGTGCKIGKSDETSR